MPSKPVRAHGALGKLRGWLRGDRYMVDAWPKVPAPPVTPAPSAAATPAEKKA